MSEAMKQTIRTVRDNLLVEDVDVLSSKLLWWEALPEETKQLWRNYRQALLDVPEQSGFPTDITWPTKPE
tara:strand:- start:653 stop:862 length:210 start_codon:yes stop_codon:yes gene_type:complete